jgi:hypothetical protein
LMSLLGRRIERSGWSRSDVLGSVGLLRIFGPTFGAPISGPAKSVKTHAFEASVSEVMIFGAF